MKNISEYFKNSFWMLLEQGIRILSGLFVGIYIARYLGPERFGVLSYVMAINAFLIAISKMGMDSILVREIVKENYPEDRLFSSAFFLTLITSVLGYLLLVFYLSFSDENNDVKDYLIIGVSGSLFTCFLCIDYFFQAKIKSKFSLIAKVIALAVMAVFKVYLVFVEAELYWFLIAYLFDFLILALMLFLFLYLDKESFSLRFFIRPSFNIVSSLYSSIWPMLLSTVAVLVYMRIDQIMIKSMLTLEDVGLYSAGVKVYEGWIAFPYILSISILPLIVKLKAENRSKYIEGIRWVFSLVFWMSFFVIIIVTFFSEFIVVLAFGEDFKRAADVVNVSMWTALFTTMGSVSARYFNAENLEKKIAKRTLVAAVLNVFLNLIMIPRYGIVGAAYSTLACTFIANYLMDWLDKDLQELLKIKHQSIMTNPFKVGFK